MAPMHSARQNLLLALGALASLSSLAAPSGARAADEPPGVPTPIVSDIAPREASLAIPEQQQGQSRFYFPLVFGGGRAQVPPPPPNNGAAISFTPDAIPFDEEEIVNPFRGLYRWRNSEMVTGPFPRRSYDSYDRFEWRDLEPELGRYDFSKLEAALERAEREGRKFGLRVRTLVDGDGSVLPEGIEGVMERGWWHDYDRDGKRDSYVPDWNDPDFQSNFRRFMLELGRRYDGDPRIGYVDIGGYGNYGEWHTWRFPYPSPSGAKRADWTARKAIIDAHLDAFKLTQLVAMTDDEEALLYILQQSPRIGWRRDSFGDPHFNDITKDERVWPLLKDRWKTAPVIVEWIGPNRMRDPLSYQLAVEQVRRFHISKISNGNMPSWNSISSSGRNAFITMAKAAGYRLELTEVSLPQQLRPGTSFVLQSNWQNVGVAPVYEPWRVTVQLRNPQTGAVAWQSLLMLDLRSVQPAETPDAAAVPIAQRDQLSLPASLPTGNYDLTLLITDPRSQREPLALAIRGQQDDGSYRLGSVTVR